MEKAGDPEVGATKGLVTAVKVTTVAPPVPALVTSRDLLPATAAVGLA